MRSNSAVGRMRWARWISLCVTTIWGSASWATPASQPVAAAKEAAPSKDELASGQRELKRRLSIVTEELATLKEKLVLPEKEELKSVWGLGPAASRVYRSRSGLSFGGYGEFFFDVKAKDKTAGKDRHVADMLRYVQYVGYKFTDKLLVNVELEVEHGTTGSNYAGSGGSVSVEFAAVEYLAHRMLNLRAGVLLMPVGFINELHEPPFFHGALRPDVESRIIPTTWRELGVGIFGEVLPGLSYKLYGVTGFNGLKFGESGWRSGRQKGGRALMEDIAVVFAASYDWRSIVQLGGSFYYGGADHDRLAGGESATTLLAEGRAQLRHSGFELRVLGVYSKLSGAAALSRAVYPDPTEPGADPETRLVGSAGYGFYAEAAYDLWPLLFSSSLYLAPYVRYEMLDSQAEAPKLAGRAPSRKSKRRIIEAGLTFKPHPQVVLKAGYRDIDDDTDSSPADSFTFGVGFIY